MGALRLGFNPHIAPESRRRLHERLREVVDVAVRLEFEIVELNLPTALYELGLSTVFDGGAIEILDDAPVRFHLNVFADTAHGEWPSVTDLSASSRGVALRQFVQIVEFFEQRQPMGMYVVHPGRRTASESVHMDALRESFRTMHNLFPGLPISVENARKGAVLSDLDSVLGMLEATGNVRFSLHTGRAFHSVDANHLAFEARIDYLRRFADRLAEIRWHNTAPGRDPSLPLHVVLERGLDVPKLMRTIGRNPGTIHMIETVGLSPRDLFKEARALHRALGA